MGKSSADTNRNQAFSLVELSIVLVILGLLVGGILAGQSLIRAAELRAVVTESNRYLTATQAFRDKYFALPGDMTNATAFWGKDNTNCSGNTGTAATPGTCNGDGSGWIANSPAGNKPGEMFAFWQHLAFAGLIEGNYSGLSSSGGIADSTIGVNVPRSRLSGGGWSVGYNPNYGGDPYSQYAYDYGNYFTFAATTAGNYPSSPLLKPEEAWNIDTKFDDGKPATGKVIVLYWSNCTTSTSQTDATGTYKLTNSAIACGLIFAKYF